MSSDTYTASDGSTWNFRLNNLPIPTRLYDWEFWHDDYDGAPDSGDRRHGNCATMFDVPAAVEALIEELRDE